MPISVKTFEILKMSRCADISDAMDSMGLQDLYCMSPDMRPLIPQTRFCGIARTVEYVRTDERLPYMEYEDFERLQYAKKSDGGYSVFENLEVPTAFDEIMNVNSSAGKDAVIVCACHGLTGGVWGSENAHNQIIKGVAGIVFDGYMRDTDECILEKLPVFSKGISYVHPQGRLKGLAGDRQVVCGGVTVLPGDVISADHDGIIVIPARYADEVAYRSYKIQQIDRGSRRRNYEKAGLPFDDTVELLPDLDRWF